ncbi:DUF4385 domain-containing protein [Rubrobacter aplysinae]|uniref:DUF4385 domain-containing protein n=1 Tax=Rubrobacter aplysinae TaxID=909625 RepID=UPI00064BE6D6|nr:DUF4385 domain-containing protein [Rubrobacter aplysinae]
MGVEGEFDYGLDFENTDFRKRPELYKTGRGEQGVLLVEPYKSEILPHWRFKTPGIARESSEKIYAIFLEYREAGDFVGMDMARKFLQMGYTRARRYANHRSGRKYEEESKKVRPQDEGALDGEKAAAARIFYEKYVLARDDEYYAGRRRNWAEREKSGEDPTE